MNTKVTDTRQRIRQGILIVSFLLFPITIFYFSPYLIVWGAINGIVVGSFAVFLIQFVFALLFGRRFCGWVWSAAGLPFPVIGHAEFFKLF